MSAQPQPHRQGSGRAPDAASVVIVGMGGVLPGADSLEAFWSNVLAGKDAAREAPPGRWLLPADAAFQAGAPAPDCIYSRRACFVDGFTPDLSGLALSAGFLQRLDPLFHLALHAARDALRDARMDAVDPARVGVIIGNIALPTETSSALTREAIAPLLAAAVGVPLPPTAPAPTDPHNHFVAELPAGVIARAFGFGGGVCTLDAACASSLYALALAADELLDGRADAVLAGGVSRPDSLYTQMGFSQLRALSPSGRCAPFDADGDGLVVGEGAGFFVLKRRADALRDGDRILARLAGWGLSNDTGRNLLAPDSDGQLAALRAAYRVSGWRPSDLDLIECHATGTPVGDAVEMTSLARLWADEPRSDRRCILGSVKSNVGHLLTGAGAAGVLKVLKAFEHGVLPPTANFRRAPAGADLTAGPFEVLREPRAFEPRAPGTPYRAAVSAFGLGGINAHLLFEAEEPGVAAVSADPPATVTAVAAAVREPIAVVGVDARLGGYADFDAVRRGLLEGLPARQCEARWWGHPGDAATGPARGHFLRSFDLPLARFRIPPRELEEALPQQLLMLITAAGAIDDAGLASPLGPTTGVFVGHGLDPDTNNFHLRWWLPTLARAWNRSLDLGLDEAALERWVEALRAAIGPALTANRTMGALAPITASRIARHFEASGPAFTLASGDTSGLRALATAVRALRGQRLDTAIVGAVDLAGDLRTVLARRGLFEDGCEDGCEDGGEDSEATDRRHLPPPGEGAVALVLKRRSDAIRAGDRIYATLDGIGIRCGGGGGVDTPAAAEACTRAARDALAEAGSEAAAVGYLETHGSGRGDEDRAEAAGLQAVYGPGGENEAAGSRVIGRIPALIGDAGSAAGLARVLRACLALHHRTLPSGPADPTPAFPPGTGAGHILSRSRPWPADTAAGPRLAAVSSMSLDGNCAHVVLREGDAAEAALSADRVAVARPSVAGPVLSVELRRGPISAPPPPRRAVEAAPPPASDTGTAHLLRMLVEADAARREAHQAYLEFSDRLGRNLARTLEARVVPGPTPGHAPAVEPRPTLAAPRPDTATTASAACRFDREQCLRFAVGGAAEVLGPAFAPVDAFPTRVRLPDEPLMLVDRILTIEAEERALDRGRIVTEHDVLTAGWYLDGGRVPAGIAIESGQADLFLSAYLGIDFETRGLARYRLLDAAVTFHRELPAPGETVRYDIHIDNFFRQGETYLFRFRFEGTVNGEPVLTMRDGCAGFFTAAELDSGRGIVPADRKRLTPARGRVGDWAPLLPFARERYDAAALDALRRGDLVAAFGEAFAGLSCTRPLTLPGGRLRTIDRIVELDPDGGRYGCGLVRAEQDIDPQAWFLTCHFVDDRVMPGTLMYECSLQALRVFLLRLGWVAEDDGAAFQPVPGVDARLKCRGQVLETTRTAAYEIHVKEIGYRPEPYALADTIMYADDRAIVHITDMNVRLTGVTREQLEALWRHRPTAGEPTAIFDHDRILAFACGRPSDAFGAAYRPFDQERFIARLPAPPFNFLHRVTQLDGVEAWRMRAGGSAQLEYDVAPDDWYFAADRQPRMPYAVLLEAALQSCGWLAAYMGSALTSDTDLHFRNLGGEATAHAPVGPDAGTLTTTVTVTRVSSSAGMIIQHYDFAVCDRERLVFDGSTYFGFFSAESLASQVGIREPKPWAPAADAHADRAATALPDSSPLPDSEWRMVDRITLHLPTGGAHGLGFWRGTARVDPDRWFFRAHFLGDPVWPGSLGLESLIQLLKVVAVERWNLAPDTVFESPLLGETHRWVYRGQIVPADSLVTVEASISAVDDETRLLRADGYLMIDGRIIYRMEDFGLRVTAGR